jgi:heme/copper-type cytochrome/quinol oxidase subunit 1
MTLTETRPEPATEIPLVPPPVPEPRGFAAAIGTGDHKKIGRLYIVLSLLYLIVAVGGSAALAVEQVDQTGYQLFGADTYFQGLTLVGQGLVYLAVLPLLLGIAISVVPLQVGSRTIAFPRAATASFWGYAVGGAMLVASYALNGGPGGGDEQAVDLWILSLGIVVSSLLLGAVCVATTVVTLRTPGMYLNRVPLFSWAWLVTAAMWLLTLPVLLAALVIAYLDHRYGRVGLGGNYNLYPWVHWTLRQPQVFLYALPVLGIVAEIVPVFAGTRQRLHKTAMALMAAVGALGFGAYTMLVWQEVAEQVPVLDITAGDWAVYENWVLVAGLVLLPLPVLLVLGGWTDTLVRGRRRTLGAPLVFALAAGLCLLVAASAAALSAIEPLGLLQTSWSAGVGVLALGAAIVAALGAIQYWGVKITGRVVGSGPGLLAAGLVLVGVLLAGAGQLVAGAFDQPDVVLVAAAGAVEPFDGVLDVRDAVDTANLATTAGWVLLAAGVAVFALGLLGAVVKPRDEETPSDPWEGFTLEWATTSPPQPANFDQVALVTSPTPLLDQRPVDADDEGSAA